MRLLIAGTVDLGGTAAVVARSDPGSLFREVRLSARRADWAVVVTAAGGEAGPLLAAAGFDAVVCPSPRPLADAGAAAGGGEVRLRCVVMPGAGIGGLLAGLSVTVGDHGPWTRFGADVTVASSGEDPSVAVLGLPAGRRQLMVSGLGALLSGDGAGGSLLEVLADEDGPIAYRLGPTTHTDFRVHFAGWSLPDGDAALLSGEWWTLARPVIPVAVRPPPSPFSFDRGDLTAAALGDVTGDGALDIAASYRHPFQPSALSEARPGAVGVDSMGRSAHLGVFTPQGEAQWAAGLIPRAVGDLAACDGSVALAYTGLDDPGVVATGAAVWQGFGLRPAPELPGPGVPGCADVDGDDRLAPVVLGRDV